MARLKHHHALVMHFGRTQATTIVVAHRLSTIRRLDRILVFDAGKIVEDGSHAELMAKPDGVYRHLLEVQLGTGEIAAAAD